MMMAFLLAAATAVGLDGASWIGERDNPAPAFARTFEVRGEVVAATLYVTGVGYYEARLNGQKVGRKVLDPTPTDYTKRVYFSAFDVREFLRSGANELTILLGNGLYNVQCRAAWDFDRAPWRDFPRAIASLDVAFADGSSRRLVTDGSWQVVASPVAYNDFREGEVVLSAPRRVGPPRTATVVPGPAGRLVPETHPGAEIIRTYPVRMVESLPDGATVYDFGYNLAGWARIRFSGLKKGAVVSIRYDERHPSESRRHIDMFLKAAASTNACPFLDARTIGFQTDHFVSDGRAVETYEPRFTYNGFRYVTVRGATPVAADVMGCFVRTAFPKTGSFTCDNEMFNRLVAATELAYEGNFTDGYPTDCPHREKNGWLGDAAIAIELAQYAYGSESNAATYRSWIQTLSDQQDARGAIANICPTSGWGLNAYSCSSGPAWGVALTTIQWTLWRFRADRRALEEAYPAMVRYADLLASETANVCTHGLGDWCSVKQLVDKLNWTYRTSMPFTSTVYACLSFREVAATAEVLGDAATAERFRVKVEKTRGAFNAAFYRGNGVYELGYPCGQALALEFGMVEPSEVAQVRRQLVKAVQEEGDQIDFGLLGSRVVFRQLSEAGETDLAWKLIMREEFPGFAHWIREGATTLWENFRGTTSRNHVMFGDFVAWAYAYVAGIRPTQPGFRRFSVKPCPPKALSRVEATVPTPFGDIRVAWQKKDGRFSLRLDVPDGTCADVTLSNGQTTSVSPGQHMF